MPSKDNSLLVKINYLYINFKLFLVIYTLEQLLLKLLQIACLADGIEHRMLPERKVSGREK